MVGSRRAVVVVVAVVGVLLGAAAIVFIDFESGDEELYAIRLDGTGTVCLTTNGCADLTPAASPDGAGSGRG